MFNCGNFASQYDSLESCFARWVLIPNLEHRIVKKNIVPKYIETIFCQYKVSGTLVIPLGSNETLVLSESGQVSRPVKHLFGSLDSVLGPGYVLELLLIIRKKLSIS